MPNLDEGSLEILIEVTLSEPLLVQLLGPDLHEGRWQKDGETRLMFRVDAAHTGTNTERHVHIAQQKHTTAKDKQVSWGMSGKRHDAKTFDTNFSRMKSAEDVARRVLKLSASVVLEEISKLNDLVDRLFEGNESSGGAIDLLLEETASVEPIRFRVVT